MTVFHDAVHQAGLPAGGIGTIGNFDGVHRGQRAIIDHVVAAGRALGIETLVVTFEPHPLELLQPSKAPLRLTTARQKADLLSEAGIDHVFVVKFDEAFSRTPARGFAEEFLFGTLNLREIYVGSRFVFGRDREGDLALLESVARGLNRRVEGVKEVLHQGEAISSTRIRHAVRAGKVEHAAEMLGRAYSVAGEVSRGAGKGRDLGWPTINLEVENELLPAVGVYSSMARLGGEDLRRPAVTNVGVRPTIHQDSQITVESHILDFAGDLYGRRVELDFRHRLRGERRFSGIEELSEQIARDAARARELIDAEVPAD
ncbi:MAG: bifunctional riboflavin kinase/FAD synthetase [Acidobacteriota bacterium]|nr:bifunctional riboflavin kinase/FAD synthetase [Acidobacteriota bacterium]